MINDKTAWFAFLHSLADIIRNGKSKFTGHDALNEMNNLLLLRFIQHRIGNYNNNGIFIPNKNKESLFSDDKKNLNGLDEECMFDYIYYKYCINYENEIDKNSINNELYTLLYGQDRQYNKEEKINSNGETIGYETKLSGEKKSIFLRLLYSDDVGLGKIYNNDLDMQQFIHKITGFTSKHVPDIINLIKKIYCDLKDINFNEFNYDGFGDAYEKYKSEDQGNGKTFGQHFTRRDVIELIVNELKPKYNEICYDPACGTGGFLHAFDTYIKKNLENDKDKNKKYKIFKNNIYGREIESKIYKALMFNMMIHQIQMDNIDFLDSLCEENNNSKYDKCMINKVDVIGANPPFGMSINIDYNPNKKMYPILAKNSVCLFLQHMVNCLKIGGRCGVVIDRGILNNGNDSRSIKNSWQTNLRKYLLDENNLYKIILLPTGIFSHTKFATAIIFFIKGEKTKQTEFIEGYFKDEDKGKGCKTMYLNKGININYDTIKNKNYSLKYEDYNQSNKDDEVKDGWVKLGDVVEFIEYESKKDDHKVNNGKFPFYNSTIHEHLYCDNPTNNDECLIINKVNGGGKCKIFYNNGQFSATSAVIIFKPNSENLNIKYLYYILTLLKKNIELKYAGGDKKSITLSSFKKLQIPTLPIAHQEKIVKLLDKCYEKYKIEDTIKYFSNYNIFNLLLCKKYDDFELVLYYQEELPKLIYQKNQVVKYKNDYIRSLFCSVKSEKVKLDDIVKFNIGGTPSTKNSDYWNGSYKWVCVAELNDNIIYDTEKKITEEGIKNSSVKEIEIGSTLMSFKLSIGKFAQAGCIMYCNEAIMFFKHNNPITHKFITYYLKFTVLEQSKKLTNGNIGNGSLNKETIKKLLILVPSLEDQEKIIKDIEKIESEQSSYAEYAKLIQVQIDSINQVIKNISLNSDNDLLLDDVCDNNSVSSNDDKSISSGDSESSDCSDTEEDIKHNIVTIKDIDYIEEDGNYYSIDTNGKKDCLCYTTDSNGKIKKYKNILIKEPLVMTMLSKSSGRNNKNNM